MTIEKDTLIPPIYSSINVLPGNKKFIVRLASNYGLVNLNHEILIPIKYKSLQKIENGFLAHTGLREVFIAEDYTEKDHPVYGHY